ncbi:MAG: hypothetical protein AB7K35_14315, partial [Pseudorhodoplanes sp.]
MTTLPHSAAADPDGSASEVDGAGLFGHAPPLGVQQWLGLVRPHAQNVGRRAVLLALIGWAPLLAFALLQSLWLRADHLTPLLWETGLHARYLAAVPILVLAEAWCIPQLNVIVQNFVRGGIVDPHDHGRFSDALSSTRKLLRSRAAEIAVFAIAYATVLATIVSYRGQPLPAWAESAGLTPVFSPAGWWHMLVSLPLLLVLILGWLWRLGLWSRLLWRVSRLDLKLVASHPDHAAGLGFLGQSLRAYAPVAMALAAVAAGRSAHLVLTGSGLPTPQLLFNVGLAVALVTLFAAPLFVFTPILMRAWRRGAALYGALADEVGHAFERKWLDGPKEDRRDVLQAVDFSAVSDLYAVVSNVHSIRFAPLDIRDLIALVAAILLPCVPVALLAFPLEEIWSAL